MLNRKITMYSLYPILLSFLIEIFNLLTLFWILEGELDRLRGEVQRKKELQLNYDNVEKSYNLCKELLDTKQEQYSKQKSKNPSSRYAMSPFEINSTYYFNILFNIYFLLLILVRS